MKVGDLVVHKYDINSKKYLLLSMSEPNEYTGKHVVCKVSETKTGFIYNMLYTDLKKIERNNEQSQSKNR